MIYFNNPPHEKNDHLQVLGGLWSRGDCGPGGHYITNIYFFTCLDVVKEIKHRQILTAQIDAEACIRQCKWEL